MQSYRLRSQGRAKIREILAEQPTSYKLQAFSISRFYANSNNLRNERSQTWVEVSCFTDGDIRQRSSFTRSNTVVEVNWSEKFGLIPHEGRCIIRGKEGLVPSGTLDYGKKVPPSLAAIVTNICVHFFWAHKKNSCRIRPKDSKLCLLRR